MPRIRLSTPQIATTDIVEIESFTVYPESFTIEVVFTLKANDGTVHLRQADVVSSLPAIAQTQITTLTSRILNLLQTRGIIPAGIEE